MFKGLSIGRDAKIKPDTKGKSSKSKQEKMRTNQNDQDVKATAENQLKLVKYKAFLGKWVPILVLGPFAWSMCCLFNLFWGPIVSEALYFCSDISTCYQNLEISTSTGDAVTSEADICGPPRDFVRYHTWTGFLYLMWQMLVFFSPIVGCTYCSFRSINTIIAATILFGVIFLGGLLFALAIEGDAELCRDDHQKHTLYFTVRIFFVQLILLFLILSCYGAQMLWNMRTEKQRKKRILTLMSKKIKFSDNDKAKARSGDDDEEDEEEEEEEKEDDDDEEEDEDGEEDDDEGEDEAEEEEEDSTKVEENTE